MLNSWLRSSKAILGGMASPFVRGPSRKVLPRLGSKDEHHFLVFSCPATRLLTSMMIHVCLLRHNGPRETDFSASRVLACVRVIYNFVCRSLLELSGEEARWAGACAKAFPALSLFDSQCRRTGRSLARLQEVQAKARRRQVKAHTCKQPERWKRRLVRL